MSVLSSTERSRYRLSCLPLSAFTEVYSTYNQTYSFSAWSDEFTRHRDEDLEHFHYPQNFLGPQFSQPLCQLPQFQGNSDLPVTGLTLSRTHCAF